MTISLLYEWEETSENVIIQIKITGINRAKLDVLISRCYVKINCTPHFVDFDLLNDIDVEESKATQSKDWLTLTLRKLEKDHHWGKLKLEMGVDMNKEQLLERRRNSVDELYAQEQKRRDEFRKAKHMETKRLFNMQWDLEKDRRRTIEEIKEEERLVAERDLYSWKSRIESDEQNGDSSSSPPDDGPIESMAAKAEESLKVPVPPVRRHNGPIRIKFTPRAMRGPAREEKDEETLRKYEVWKKGSSKKNFDEDPNWMKDKGDKFFRKGNFEAAVNAYSEALRRSEYSMVSSFANRAACYMKLNRFADCIRDCTTVLEWEEDSLDPLAKKTTLMNIKALARRGAAFAKCNKLQEAVRDYERAVQMDKSDDTSLIDDLRRLQDKLAEQAKPLDHPVSSDSLSPEIELKNQADSLFIDGRFKEAIIKYTEALNIEPHMFEAIANRSVCFLKLGTHGECLDDCTRIIETIYTVNNPPSNAVHLVYKSYIRRAKAHYELGDLSRCYDDYESAYRMDSSDGTAMEEMKKVATMLEEEVKAESYKLRGNALFQKGEYKSAIYSYSLAISKEVHDPALYSNRALCHLKLKDYIQCIEDCNTGLSIVPEDPKLQVRKKISSGKEGANPLDDIATNALLTPELQVKLYIRRGTAYRELDELKAAIIDFQRAISIEPNLQKERKILADIMQEQERQGKVE